MKQKLAAKRASEMAEVIPRGKRRREGEGKGKKKRKRRKRKEKEKKRRKRKEKGRKRREGKGKGSLHITNVVNINKYQGDPPMTLVSP